mmetsp:Transcript_28483/g.53385  ORF Transcript_28483/g.53385 Transcript_28483/m.53385 type:complete len:358 (+) Transcript_28483:370-1443(+)
MPLPLATCSGVEDAVGSQDAHAAPSGWFDGLTRHSHGCGKATDAGAAHERRAGVGLSLEAVGKPFQYRRVDAIEGAQVPKHGLLCALDACLVLDQGHDAVPPTRARVVCSRPTVVVPRLHVATGYIVTQSQQVLHDAEAAIVGGPDQRRAALVVGGLGIGLSTFHQVPDHLHMPEAGGIHQRRRPVAALRGDVGLGLLDQVPQDLEAAVRGCAEQCREAVLHALVFGLDFGLGALDKVPYDVEVAEARRAHERRRAMGTEGFDAGAPGQGILYDLQLTFLGCVDQVGFEASDEGKVGVSGAAGAVPSFLALLLLQDRFVIFRSEEKEMIIIVVLVLVVALILVVRVGGGRGRRGEKA